MYWLHGINNSLYKLINITTFHPNIKFEISTGAYSFYITSSKHSDNETETKGKKYEKISESPSIRLHGLSMDLDDF